MHQTEVDRQVIIYFWRYLFIYFFLATKAVYFIFFYFFSAGVSSCLKYISSLITSFLKDKRRGPPTIQALLLQFKNSEVLTAEDKVFSKNICESLQFEIKTGTTGDNYMEVRKLKFHLVD